MTKEAPPFLSALADNGRLFPAHWIISGSCLWTARVNVHRLQSPSWAPDAMKKTLRFPGELSVQAGDTAGTH